MTLQKLPVIGRNAELGIIRKAYSSARSGAGRLIEITGEPGLGKSRLLDTLRDAAAGFRKLHASCDAYTASTPYALWSDLLRELLRCGREDAEAAVSERLQTAVATRVPELAPWLPLIAIALRIEVAPTPEVQMLAEANRRSKLHECVRRFLRIMMPETALIEIENAQHMDAASAEFLHYLTERIDARPWLFAVTRRSSDGGFVAPEAPTVVRIELKPLAPADALRLTELATQQSPLPARVLEAVAKRSGGNPQFLRDLLRTAIESGDIADLPESADAAAKAQIDGLAPDDRAVIARAAMFGIRFHPKMFAWFADSGAAAPDPTIWERLRELFYEEPRGYLRFRRPVLRDAAYASLPDTMRRDLHRVIAGRLETEMNNPEEAGVLSLHYFEAGEYRAAFRYASLAARHADGVYAYAGAAELYSRAVEAARRLGDIEHEEIAAIQQALGESWYRAGEFRKASDAFAIARPMVAGDPIADVRLLIKLSHLEEKLGKHADALRWTEQARATLQGLDSAEAARQRARAGAWYAELMQAEGRASEALECAERSVAEAQTADDTEALAAAYLVMAEAYDALGREGAESLMQRSLDAYQRSGNLEKQIDVLSKIGAVWQAEGHWDEAVAYYERARDAAQSVGSTASAAIARVNIAEILVDRGEWADAEALLMETLPVWKASQYRYYFGRCLVQLGRVMLLTGRFNEALARLEEAKANFQHVGSEQDIAPVEACIGECRLAMGNSVEALALARRLLAEATKSQGLAKVMPRLERLQAHALLRQGDLWSARESLEGSLATARERHNLFDTAITMLSLIELDRAEGVEPTRAMVTESHSLLSKLKIRAVPPVLFPAQ